MEELADEGLDMDVLAPRTLLSPAKAIDAAGKNAAPLLSMYMTKPQGAPTLAPESDRRPELPYAREFSALDW
jgi:hypothetical protein